MGNHRTRAHHKGGINIPIPFDRKQSPAEAKRGINALNTLQSRRDRIQRDVNQRKIPPAAAQQMLSRLDSQIKDLKQYMVQTPVNVRSSTNPYRTFSIPYTATAKIKPPAVKPKPQQPKPAKGSVQSKMIAQRNRLQQASQARAPRASISKLPKAKTKVVNRSRRRRSRQTTAVTRARAQARMRARRAMGPTRSKGNRKARSVDRTMSRRRPRTSRFRRNTRANRALAEDRTSAQSKSVSDRQKAMIAQQKRLRANRRRREEEKKSIRSQAKSKSRRIANRASKSRAAKQLKKTTVAKKLSKVRSKKSSVAAKKKSAKKRVSRLRKRLRFGQANIGSVRLNEGLGEAMVELQHELAQAQHEENQLAALFGQLAKEEANLVQQLYADEDQFGSTAPRHQRISREPMASSGKSFYDTREFNTYASALARDSAGVPTPAYKELVRTYNNNITNGQFSSVNAAKKTFMQQVASNRGQYFTRTITPKQQAQDRQLGILTVQKNRMAKSAPEIRTMTARQRAFYEQQRVAEDARTTAAESTAKVEQQLAGFFPRTRSAMERMTR